MDTNKQLRDELFEFCTKLRHTYEEACVNVQRIMKIHTYIHEMEDYQLKFLVNLPNYNTYISEANKTIFTLLYIVLEFIPYNCKLRNIYVARETQGTVLLYELLVHDNKLYIHDFIMRAMGTMGTMGCVGAPGITNSMLRNKKRKLNCNFDKGPHKHKGLNGAICSNYKDENIYLSMNYEEYEILKKDGFISKDGHRLTLLPINDFNILKDKYVECE